MTLILVVANTTGTWANGKRVCDASGVRRFGVMHRTYSASSHAPRALNWVQSLGHWSSPTASSALLTAGDIPQPLAVYATKDYTSCASRRTHKAAIAQRLVKRTWGARWHLDTLYPYYS